MALTSVEAAEQIIHDRVPPLSPERVPLAEAVGRVLRQDVRAERNHPPFNRAMMDGIVLASSDVEEGIRVFSIVGVHPAGQPPPEPGGKGTCYEIMTGAVVPDGLDCVVPVEMLQIEDGKARLLGGARADAGRFVHPEGSDRKAGAVLLEAGRVLRAPEIAVLAAEGCARVEVAARPRLCVIATGDELVTEEAKPLPHQIRSSNAPAISAGLRLFGWGDAEVLHLRDDKSSLLSSLQDALRAHDVLILSGGVSRGRYDFVPDVLAELGVEMHFHRVSQRPGKPMWFGTRGADGTSVFALPGNPVSSMVCLHRFVLPALLRAAGCAVKPLHLPLGAALQFEPELTWFVPVALAEGEAGVIMAMPRLTNTSGDLAALAGTDGFVELPRERTGFQAGFAGRYFSWKP